MMRSLFSGVSGLKNHQTRMDVIGNNISNVNTTGFKSSRVNFEDTISQTLTAASQPSDTTGGTNPKQIGLGSKVSAIDVNFKDGSVQSTGINTDLCLSGNALFVVKQGNQTFYTRNGAFNFDSQGTLVNAEGLKVQGYMNTSDTDHSTISTNAGTDSIVIRAGKTMPSSKTSNLTYLKNLDAKTEVGADPISTTAVVVDTLGTEHSVPIKVEKTAANTWSITLSKTTIDDGHTTLVLPAITLKFKDNGGYDEATPTTAKLNMTYDSGAATQDVSFDFSSVTQYDGSTTIYPENDGYKAGVLDTVSIDETGTVVGTYTNGILRREAQIAVAQFTNAPGLTKKGNSLYIESNNSGVPNIGTATGFGATITASALEMSNVDVAEEFSNMIITQRGFQSNSKIITVSDEMLENLINMKR